VRRTSVAAGLVVAALAGSGAAGGAGADRTVFANGYWVGSGQITGGIFGSFTANGSGTISFHMTVCNGRAASGTLIFIEHAIGTLHGYRFTGEIQGTLRIRDLAHVPIAVRGPVTVTATYRGVVSRTTTTGTGKIEGHGTVNRMTGDLAIDARAAQAAAGEGTDVTAPFVARRTARRSC
jgi:hypothetical protein